LVTASTAVRNVEMYDTRTATMGARLPAGVVSADRHVLYAVTTGDTNVLRSFDMRSGAAIDIAGTPVGFDLPRLGVAERPTGLSPNGRHLVLVGQGSGGDVQPTVSRFLLYDTSSLGAAPVRVSLAGFFEYDAISNDGRNLYLLEHIRSGVDAPPGYHVRRYDLAAHRLDPAVLVDKRTGESELSGTALDSTVSADGAWQYTVYALGDGHPMIHALNLDAQASFCIDLPAAPVNQEMDLLWGVVASHDGRFVYALNAGNGAVLRMPVSQPWEASRGVFTVPAPVGTQAWHPWEPLTVEAKRIAFGAVVISRDDRTLYGLGDHGIFAVDAAALTSTGSRLLPTQPLSSLVLSGDGRQLYATSEDADYPLLQVNPANGRWAVISKAGRPISVLLALP